MIFGAVFLFTWLVLLLRYPSKALPRFPANCTRTCLG